MTFGVASAPHRSRVGRILAHRQLLACGFAPPTTFGQTDLGISAQAEFLLSTIDARYFLSPEIAFVRIDLEEAPNFLGYSWIAATGRG